MSTTAKDRLSTGSNITHRSEPTSLKSRPDETPSNTHATVDSKASIRSERSLRATVAAGNKDVEGGLRKKLSTVECLKTIVLATKLNILLVFVPLGIVAYQLKWSEVTIFVLNFMAIIPLARLLGYATEEISLRVSESAGALLIATFGNAVELIISIVALKEHKVPVVQASVLGSVLSNLLLVLGFCFVFGGMKHTSQQFNQTAAQTSASLLSLSCLSLLIPAAFHATTATTLDQTTNIKHLSYGTSIVLLIVYGLYLLFQLKTHTHLYATSSEDENDPVLPLWMGIALLVVVTAVIVFCADYLVTSIDGLAEAWNISPVFIGLILLPIVSNAAENATAVTMAWRDKMNLAISVAIGSSMQVALFVTPLLVILGWIIDEPMTLFFNTFETCVMFVSVLIVNYLIQDGESNWLEGVMLLSTYLIIAVAIYFYPVAVETAHP
ncbi:MAG: Ca2+ transporter [Benniella sp.]|nr:MAG: Ca2+ transporter [Benniella sp.]